MKKIITICALLSILLLCSCGQSKLAKQAEIQGQLSLAAGDYTTARNTLKLSVDDGHATKQAQELYNILNAYLNSQDSLSNSDFESAKAYADSIPESYQQYTIKADIDKLKSDITNGMNDTDSVSSKITQASKLLITQKYNEALALLNSIDMRFISESDANKVQSLKNAAVSATEQLAASQKLGIEKAESAAALEHSRKADK